MSIGSLLVSIVYIPDSNNVFDSFFVSRFIIVSLMCNFRLSFKSVNSFRILSRSVKRFSFAWLDGV